MDFPYPILCTHFRVYPLTYGGWIEMSMRLYGYTDGKAEKKNTNNITQIIVNIIFSAERILPTVKIVQSLFTCVKNPIPFYLFIYLFINRNPKKKYLCVIYIWQLDFISIKCYKLVWLLWKLQPYSKLANKRNKQEVMGVDIFRHLCAKDNFCGSYVCFHEHQTPRPVGKEIICFQ